MFPMINTSDIKFLIILPNRRVCSVGQEKNPSTSIYFYTNYRAEMKLLPIIIYYCLLQFDALKFFLGSVYVAGLNLTFFDVNPHIC